MTDFNDTHHPRPEFRAALRREIARAHRAELLFAGHSYRTRRIAIVASLAAGVVIALIAGLVVGASASYASAEVLSEKQRAATKSAVEMSQQFAALRMRLARANYDRVRSTEALGQATSEQLRAAQEELDSARASVRQMETQLMRAQDTLPMTRPTFAILRGWPLAGSAAAACAPAASAGRPQEPTIPTIELPTASTKSAETFGVLVNVRELAGGKLLVDDGQNRQVKVLDASLGGGKVIIDSVRGATATNYGGRPTALNPFVGDSTLFANQAEIVSIIDPEGNLSRAIATVTPRDAGFLRWAGVDSASRIIFQSEAAIVRAASDGQPPIVSDSAPILRSDLVARRNDTLAFVARPLIRIDAIGRNPASKQMTSSWRVDALRELDEWAVLSSGALAVVRGHDYHVDIIRPDGSKVSGPRLPFDWRTVTDDEKRKLIDSAMTQLSAAAERNTLIAGVDRVTPWKWTGATPDTSAAVPSNNIAGLRFLVLPWPKPTIEHVFDYYPPVRSGSVLADLDDHLWILPTTSKQSKAGELVYDVVDNKGALVSRVRLPVGRYIVGFGRGGVVYMATGSIGHGFTIERTKLPAPVGTR